MLSMAQGAGWQESGCCCSQICNWEFLKAQRRSTTLKMQPAESKGYKMYTKKVTHLIPNQIPKLGETC